MGSEAEAGPTSTPKLSFYSLPSKESEPAGMLTPPLRPPAAVPFVWEEAPGKPRNCELKPMSARSLDLPPRLLNEIKNINLPSPTTVLDGPYVGRSASCSSFRDVSHRSFKTTLSSAESYMSSSPKKGQLGGDGGWSLQKKEKEKMVGFWGKMVVKGRKGHRRVESTNTSVGEGEGGLGFSFPPPPAAAGGSFVESRDRKGVAEEEMEVKITRFRRNRSLLSMSNTTTHFWATIYGSFKHVVPWRVRKLKKDGHL